jgi:Ankyrin repeats (3 copies)
MLTPKAKHVRVTSWTIFALELGAILFAAGLIALYLNPFWHFDEGGFLDWRMHWWNVNGEILTAAGLLIEASALVAAIAVLISQLTKRSSWPYIVAGFSVVGVVVWIGTEGFVGTEDAHFEWNAAEGFTVFQLQSADQASEAPPFSLDGLRRSIVEIQIQPLLRGYFKINDWQKMNGDIGIKVVRGIPITWPIGLGGEDDTFEDPDETALMQAAEQQDLKTLQQLLSTATLAEVNALDQNGQTALILACRNPKASRDVVKALLAAGADVNLRARNGYAPLTWALARNNGEIARILRGAGARQ